MKLIAGVIFGLLVSGAANAGCDEELSGKRRGIEYYIGNEACGLPETRLIISKPAGRYYDGGQSFSFLGQCNWTASGFCLPAVWRHGPSRHHLQTSTHPRQA